MASSVYEQESCSPPPLPPDEPPPLPPEDFPLRNAPDGQDNAWAQYDHSVTPQQNFTQYSEPDAPPIPPSYSAASQDWAPPPPPPGPPSPAAEGPPLPWHSATQQYNSVGEQTAGSGTASTTQPSVGAQLPEVPGSTPWQQYHPQAQGEASAATLQPWQSQWGYQEYQSYDQMYEQYGGYDVGQQSGYQEPTHSYQQPAIASSGAPPGYQHSSTAGAYGYQPQPGYAQPAHPWTQAQVPIAPAVVPTKNEVDAVDIFHKPGRQSRATKIAVIMRGLPGSGKTHIAKRLREIEVENGGEAPRIHSLDDYFVTEVEKEVIDEQPGMRPKRRKVTVMEYLYEQELEDSYRASILKAFSKTVEEGRFSFVILDAPNIQVEDFRPFYMFAQQMGYEVFVLKPLESDPEICFKRNIHQRDQDTIADLAALYEPTPNLFTQMNVDSLFGIAKNRKSLQEEEQAIEEIDMEEDAQETDNLEGHPEIKSRWSVLDGNEDIEAAEEEVPKRRKKRKQDEGEVERPATSSKNGKVARESSATSILRKPGAAPPNKGLRWADQVAPAEGFTIGGSASQQLEAVHYVEGLGPSPNSKPNNLTHSSFVEMARKERTTEKQSFKDILLGNRRA